jgi:hypothetical protein
MDTVKNQRGSERERDEHYLCMDSTLNDISLTVFLRHPYGTIAKSFVNGLLTADPEHRMTAARALQHPWLAQDQQPLHPYQQQQPSAEALQQQMQGYGGAGDMDGVVQHDLLPNMMARMRARTKFRNAIRAVSAINRMRGEKEDPRHIRPEEVSHVLHREDEDME